MGCKRRITSIDRDTYASLGQEYTLYDKTNYDILIGLFIWRTLVVIAQKTTSLWPVAEKSHACYNFYLIYLAKSNIYDWP